MNLERLGIGYIYWVHDLQKIAYPRGNSKEVKNVLFLHYVELSTQNTEVAV